MSEQKDHYRKVFKSDHLGQADLEDLIESGVTRLVFTIKEVKQEIGVRVAGVKGDHNIAYFKENIKPMVLNATNSKVVKSFVKDKSPFVQDWKNILVELYIDPTIKMKGDVVGGVRIKPTQPKLGKPELTPDLPAWDNAKSFVKNGGDIAAILKKYSISDKNLKELKNA